MTKMKAKSPQKIPHMHNPKITREEERLLRERFADGSELDEAMRRVAAGEPVQYVTGIAYFYDEVYTVTPDCLIPRPDTERLVELAVKLAGKRALRMLDLCTGSGCIAVSAAAHCPNLNVTAVELSEGALKIAKLNADKNGVSERVGFVHADICDPEFISSLPYAGYDIITSNPPYIATDVILTLDESVRREPRIALDGGADGLDFYRVILREYGLKLTDDGVMLLEIGYDQADALRALAAQYGYSCEIHRDYGGNERVAELKRI